MSLKTIKLGILQTLRIQEVPGLISY